MGLYKRKDSQFYWMAFSVGGVRVNESTKTTNKRLAERIHARRLGEIEEGRWFSNEAKRRTFEELKDRYMKEHSTVHKSETSCDRDVYSFKRLSEFFEGMTLAEITPSRISEYKSVRQSKGVKVSTVSKELELLRNALNLAIREWEWLESNPFEKVKIEKPNNRVERWLTPEEEKRLLDASPVWLREIIVFALYTGMRQGEILSLKWPHVDLFRRTITLLKTKNKEKRTIPINQTVLELLQARGKVRHISGYVFTSQAGTKILPRNLLRAFYAARKKAELEDLRFHDLRHSFATALVQAGINIYVVKELLGHKTLAMTLRYAHHYPESLRHGVEALDRGCYVFATVKGKRRKKGSKKAPNPLISMVGDTGFEPVTSAV